MFAALTFSVDGYITGPDPSPEQPLGTGGGQLFDWWSFPLASPTCITPSRGDPPASVRAVRLLSSQVGGIPAGTSHPAPLMARRAPEVATGMAVAVARDTGLPGVCGPYKLHKATMGGI